MSGSNPNAGAACTDPSCRWIDVSGQNFPPNTSVTVSCHSIYPPPEQDFKSYSVTADGAGNFTVTNTGCFYGYPNHPVYVHTAGAQSNTINW